MNVGTITIKLDNVTREETERCRAIIHTFFEQGIFNIKAGKAIIHFDPTGNLQAIDLELSKWRLNKPPLSIAKLYERATIEVIPSHHKAF